MFTKPCSWRPLRIWGFLDQKSRNNSLKNSLVIRKKLQENKTCVNHPTSILISGSTNLCSRTCCRRKRQIGLNKLWKLVCVETKTLKQQFVGPKDKNRSRVNTKLQKQSLRFSIPVLSVSTNMDCATPSIFWAFCTRCQAKRLTNSPVLKKEVITRTQKLF